MTAPAKPINPTQLDEATKGGEAMTIEDYSILVSKHGEQWVLHMFPRSVKDLERRLRLKEDAHGT